MPIIAAASKKPLNEDGPALTSHLTSREDPRRFGHIALKPSPSQSRTGVGDGGRCQACDLRFSLSAPVSSRSNRKIAGLAPRDARGLAFLMRRIWNGC